MTDPLSDRPAHGGYPTARRPRRRVAITHGPVSIHLYPHGTPGAFDPGGPGPGVSPAMVVAAAHDAAQQMVDSGWRPPRR